MPSATSPVFDANLPNHQTPPSSGGILASSDGRDFVLRETRLLAQAAGGLARVVLEQRFENPFADPLQVHYTLPLPSDGAVSGFAFEVAGKRTVGVVDRREQAQRRFEKAILEGHSAALLNQERSSVFSQEIGNIPPHAELIIEITIDQRLRWLEEGQWEWRFPTVVAPRYLGAAGRVADADAVVVPVDPDSAVIGPKVSLALRVEAALPGDEPVSPSHALRISSSADAFEVALAAESASALDRDVVVRWRAARSEVAADIQVHRPKDGHTRAAEMFGLLSVTPPDHLKDAASVVSRDLVFLIDTSGSMAGEPLVQAAKVASAMIDTLGDQDRLELIEFSSRPKAWKRKPVPATKKHRKAACEWLRGLRAGGGTEMLDGIVRALQPLAADSQRQVVLITDGQVGFEQEIVEEISVRLPESSRVHTLGVGHAVNRSLTEPAARAGRGVEVILAPGEDPAPAAQRLRVHTTAPLLVNFKLRGSALIDHVPSALPDLFAGCPALIPLRLKPKGGEVVLEARSAQGSWTSGVFVSGVEAGSGNPAIACTYAREAVEDLEVLRAAGCENGSVDSRVEALGLEFQIATRLTSWVAVSESATVDPTDPTRKHRVSQALPAGMSLEQLGLRPADQFLTELGATAPLMYRYGARGLRSGGIRHGRARGRAPVMLRVGATEESSRRGCRSDRGSEPVSGSDESTEYTFLMARLVAQDASRLVFEIELDAALDWDPRQVVLTLADGTTLEVEIARKRTTRSAYMRAGQVLRLTLKIDEALSVAVEEVVIEQGLRPSLRLRLE